MSTRSTRTAIGILAVAAGLIAGCGGGDSDADSGAGTPEDTVQALYEAYQGQDAEAACAAFSADSQEATAKGFDSCEESFQDAADSGAFDNIADDFDVGEATIDGDTATVEVTGNGETNTFSLIDEDGWKVDVTATAEATDSASGDTDSTTG